MSQDSALGNGSEPTVNSFGKVSRPVVRSKGVPRPQILYRDEANGHAKGRDGNERIV